MLSKEQNERLTRVGPGTPMGELLRRYWQPVALAEELPPGGAPLPVRLLGENLVLFRDDSGQPGLLGIHCSHRGADLSYGRLEGGGLRCIYHGWLYDRAGRCLEQPGEPEPLAGDQAGADASPSASPLAAAPRRFLERIRHPAYPCHEAGGLILTYIGPGEPPLVPAYPFLTADADHRYNSKILHECNFLQANEGNFDPVHTSFLHRVTDGTRPTTMAYIAGDIAPALDVEVTDYGLRIYSVRRAGSGNAYVRLTNFVLPNLSAFAAGGPDGYSCNWHVPIDDTHHWKYVIQFQAREPLDREAIYGERNTVGADYRLDRLKENRYLQDRDEMEAATFAGLGRAFQAQDLCVTEGEGLIQDRTQEHLGRTDVAIVAARNILLAAIEAVEAGKDPPHVLRAPASAEVPSLLARADLVDDMSDWRHYWERVPVGAA
jgi:phthalate 4,5-dioxygenase oxygenase subunit